MTEFPPEIADRLPLHPNDYLVLFKLSQGECHGYGITKGIEDETGGLVRIDPSNLYRTIKRLSQDGLVADSDRRKTGDGQERRKFYRITPLGKRVVAAEAHRMESLAEAARSVRLIGRNR